MHNIFKPTAALRLVCGPVFPLEGKDARSLVPRTSLRRVGFPREDGVLRQSRQALPARGTDHDGRDDDAVAKGVGWARNTRTHALEGMPWVVPTPALYVRDARKAPT